VYQEEGYGEGWGAGRQSHGSTAWSWSLWVNSSFYCCHCQ